MLLKRFFPALLSLLICIACDSRSSSDQESTSLRQLNQTVKLDNAERIKASIKMGAGRLRVMGGAKNLVDTDISFTRESWEPRIEYTNNGTTGRLRIEQEELRGLNFNFGDEDENMWNIQLNNTVPYDLEVTMGAGESELDLRQLNLERLKIDAGVGEHEINLSGSSVPDLQINAGVGEVSVDLSGERKNNLYADINGGIGELNLLLPKGVGIRLEVNGALGSINAPGLSKDNDVYFNALYGQSEVEIELNVKAGIGSVNVSIAD
ncbi:toast rack family protein [Porifericola rhodea]|uniref:toast rack family protein n=1 Tax=Porifericola rhodea TaxID=930972 RepID=UPI002665265F|nr:toast rack family protein [Porifericola rhodea]WKN31875.1 toast rack family protein [Porifericola rhodea]